jgi:chaperone modulatory protein CbpM
MNNNLSSTDVGIILEEQTQITLNDLCAACCVQTEMIIELVEEGVLIPSGGEPPQWYFSGMHIRRAKTALNLQRDLGVNIAGVALALQLLDEIKTLRAQLNKYQSSDAT